MPFTIVRQDITKMRVDAIANAATTDLAMGGAFAERYSRLWGHPNCKQLQKKTRTDSN